MINSIQSVLNNLRSEFIVIGLTGALGSGCTKTAKFLSKSLISATDINSILDSGGKDEFDLEYRKLQRVKYFYINNSWNEFYHIRVSDLLFLFFINELDDLSSYKSIFKKEDTIDEIKKLSLDFINAISTYDNYDKNIFKDILIKTNDYINQNIDKSDSKYTPLFQDIGNNIRNEGKIFKISEKKILDLIGSDEKDLNIFIIPEIIRRVIKLVRKENKKDGKKDFFIIDALRNVYEIEFFRSRYQSFYLFSIMASEETRKNRIEKMFELTPENLKSIKEFETNDKGIESQAINSCIGKGDVFINNDKDDETTLHKQLIKYIALIRKPGLFTPNDDERFMQVAFTARYNSGCISRQVGAVVVGVDGYLRGFGWNDTPEKHIPCLYRTAEQLINSSGNKIFSVYERSSKFNEFIKVTFQDKQSRFLPFCFKDNQAEIELNDISEKIEQNNISKEDIKDILKKAKFKNPTRERALHAEENAFLQISKSGGQSVIEGTLYTTDSPCQLCAKKTMQLKIERVVYIDAYPDISVSHTLNAGEKWPAFDMFSGVIGSAYFKLYIPIIGRKDEIKAVEI